jgi:hypothetical protein
MAAPLQQGRSRRWSFRKGGAAEEVDHEERCDQLATRMVSINAMESLAESGEAANPEQFRATLRRYLCAEGWNVEKAERRLCQHVEWRLENRPCSITEVRPAGHVLHVKKASSQPLHGCLWGAGGLLCPSPTAHQLRGSLFQSPCACEPSASVCTHTAYTCFSLLLGGPFRMRWPAIWRTTNPSYRQLARRAGRCSLRWPATTFPAGTTASWKGGDWNARFLGVQEEQAIGTVGHLPPTTAAVALA